MILERTSYYLEGIKASKVEVLAKAITLIESRKPEHQKAAANLLQEVLPLTGKSRRIGVSGTPGVGKSTFLENFGMSLINSGEKIAVLAVDPTSQVTGGSILGDKTRMQHLSASPSAYIRPSPNGETLGGVAAKTREVMLLCEAFGFDTIFIETVGVGQSEIAVSRIVDFFILLMQPGSGDELQGIKRGILEVSDLVVVNKADGDQLAPAKIAQHDFKRSLEVLKEKMDWKTNVILCSSLKKEGFSDIKQEIETYFKTYFKLSQRNEKIENWMYDLLKEKMIKEINNKLQTDSRVADVLSGKREILEVIDDLYKELMVDRD